MKHLLTILAIVITIPISTLGQTSSQNFSCEQTAKELESKVSKITRDLDKTLFEQFLSDDAIIINASGETLNKKQQTNAFPKQIPNITFSFTVTNMKIRACGETSIITTGKDVIEARDTAKKSSDTQAYYFSRTYEKRQGQWQLIFNQLTSTNE